MLVLASCTRVVCVELLFWANRFLTDTHIYLLEVTPKIITVTTHVL